MIIFLGLCLIFLIFVFTYKFVDTHTNNKESFKIKSVYAGEIYTGRGLLVKNGNGYNKVWYLKYSGNGGKTWIWMKYYYYHELSKLKYFHDPLRDGIPPGLNTFEKCEDLNEYKATFKYRMKK